MHSFPYLLLILFGGNLSKEIFVSQSKDSMDTSTCGIKSHPCRTVDYALSTSGDVINIDGGTNDEAPYIYKFKNITIKHCITLQQWQRSDNKQPSPKPILQPLKRFWQSHSIHNFCFGNFTVVSVDFVDTYIHIKNLHGRIQLEDCLFKSSYPQASSFYGIVLNFPHYVFVNGQTDFYFHIKKSSVAVRMTAGYPLLWSFTTHPLSSITMRIFNRTISIDNSVLKGTFKFHLNATLTNNVFVNASLSCSHFAFPLPSIGPRPVGRYNINITNCVFKNSPVMIRSDVTEVNAYNTTFVNMNVDGTIVRVNLTKCLFRINTSRLKSRPRLPIPSLPTALSGSLHNNLHSVGRYNMSITNCVFKNSAVMIHSGVIEVNAYNTTFVNLKVDGTIVRVNLTKCLFRINLSWLKGRPKLHVPSLSTSLSDSKRTNLSQSWIRLQDTEFYASQDGTIANIFDNPSLNFYKNTSVVCANWSYANFFVLDLKGDLPSTKTSKLWFNCSRCEQGTYNFINRGTLNKNSFWKKDHKTSSCFLCPYNAICRDKKIRWTGGHWGYVNEQYKLSLISCPAYYCCLSKDECTLYNTCSRFRTGRLCSECRPGFSSDISAAYRCIKNSECKKAVVTFIIYTALALVITIVLLYLKEIIWFAKTIFRSVDNESSDRYENDDGDDDNDDDDGDDGDNDDDDEGEGGIFQLRERLLHESFIAGDSRSPIPYQILLSDDTTVMHSENYPQQSNMASGCVKIIFFYYQAAALIRIESTDKIRIVIPKFFDVLSTVFNIRLDLSYSSITWCVFPDINVIQSKMIKLGFVFIMLAVIITFWLSSCVLSILLKNRKCRRDFEEENPPPRHQQINKDVGWYSNPPFIVRVKCVYVQFLLIAFASIATFSFDAVYCIGINGKSYLYTQASIECYQPWQYVIIAFIAFWIVPFALSLHLAPKLLYQCYVSPNEFLLILSFPPAILGILVNRKFHFKKAPLTTEDAMLAKHLLSVLNQPFRESQDGGGKLCWESILILRRMLLVITKTFIVSSITKLYPMVILLLVFVSHHKKMKPFADEVLNDVEFYSLNVLISLVFVNLFWAITRDHGLMKSPEYKILSKCLVFYEMVVLSLPFLVLALYILYRILKLAHKFFTRIKNMAIQKQD